jgi:hypothetical protein
MRAGLQFGMVRAAGPLYNWNPASISFLSMARAAGVRRAATTIPRKRGNRMQWKRGEVMGVWVWILVAWIILAWVFKDFWWFRPLWREIR